MRRRIRDLIAKSKEPPPPITYDDEWPASIRTVAKKLHCSYGTAHAMFSRESGLILTGSGGGRRTVRIPKEVFERVIAARRT
jgi:hypothetical protein